MKLRIFYYYLKYKKSSKIKSREKLEKIQKRELKKLKHHLLKNSKYFREKLQNTDFDKLPFCDKKTLMDNFDDLVCVDIKLKDAMKMAINSEKSRDFSKGLNNITVGLSSGTSGHRGVFIATNQEKDMWTGAILAKVVPKLKKGLKVAFFLRANSQLYERSKNANISFEYFDIYKPMNGHIKRLNNFLPDILIAPPSVLLELSRYQEKNELQIDPNKIISVAEVLEETDRNKIGKAFNKQIIDQVYQCTEGFLGHTCEYGTLHINEDIVLIEKQMIDDKHFIPIITDFKRFSEPIIKYRLNDILVLKETPCQCGSVHLAIEKIVGREDDLLKFENSKGEKVCVYGDMICRLFLYIDGIINYEVSAFSHRLEVSIEADDNEDLEVIKMNIIKEFLELGKRLDISFPDIYFKEYEHNFDRKMKRVKNYR